MLGGGWVGGSGGLGWGWAELGWAGRRVCWVRGVVVGCLVGVLRFLVLCWQEFRFVGRGGVVMGIEVYVGMVKVGGVVEMEIVMGEVVVGGLWYWVILGLSPLP